MTTTKLERSSGILLHPTSFPGPDGIGDLGPEAFRWIDFLESANCAVWQILPLGPTISFLSLSQPALAGRAAVSLS